jgi:hypothetical protein
MLINDSRDNLYTGNSDWLFSLLRSIVPLCRNSSARKKLEVRLAEIVKAQDQKSDWTSSYYAKEAQIIQYDILCKFAGEDDTTTYMEQNTSNIYFREILIKKAIASNAFEKALKLCIDGESLDKKYPGLVWQWKEYRYSIYEKQRNIEGQKALGFEFAIDEKFDYFLKWKKLFTAKEWAVQLPLLLDSMKKHNSYLGDGYVNICINEHLTDNLLDYCKEEPSEIVKLYPHLVPKYVREVETLFLSLINRYANLASNRNAYHEVCAIISAYKRACGKKAAQDVVTQLQREHSRQPAFLDELSRV